MCFYMMLSMMLCTKTVFLKATSKALRSRCELRKKRTTEKALSHSRKWPLGWLPFSFSLHAKIVLFSLPSRHHFVMTPALTLGRVAVSTATSLFTLCASSSGLVSTYVEIKTLVAVLTHWRPGYAPKANRPLGRSIFAGAKI